MPVTNPVTANDREYPAPQVCAIAICLDGCEPEYLEKAIGDGLFQIFRLAAVQADGNGTNLGGRIFAVVRGDGICYGHVSSLKFRRPAWRVLPARWPGVWHR